MRAIPDDSDVDTDGQTHTYSQRFVLETESRCISKTGLEFTAKLHINCSFMNSQGKELWPSRGLDTQARPKTVMGTHCCFFSLRLDPLRIPILIPLILLCSLRYCAHTGLGYAPACFYTFPSTARGLHACVSLGTLYELSAVGCGALAIIPVLQRRKQIKTQMRWYSGISS